MNAPPTSASVDTLSAAFDIYQSIKRSCESKVQGRSDVIDLILIALLADGHVLLEDHPGSGKTTLAKALGECITRPEGQDHRFASFRRIQFTPDLLPSDVTGSTVFDPNSNQLTYQPGPVFANIVLADEINRTSPKVQASMLEAMAEKQVTVDNVTHPLEDIFLVLATQNPLDQAGTYPLPKAQLDRFLFKIRMTFLPREAELDVLRMKYPQCRGDEPADASPIVAAPVITPTGLVQTRQTIASHVRIDRSIQETLVDVACGLRDDKRVHQGISTRSLVVAIPALQAHAFINGRDFVTPDDIKALAFPIFGHRLELKHGLTNSDEVIETVMAPIVDRVSSQSVRLWDKAK